METYQWKKDLSVPVITSSDVVVVGAGFGGICAAIASARAGASTVLVEKNAVLGGQAAEIDTWGLDGFVSESGKLVIGGLPWEILWRAVAEGGSDTFWSRLDMDVLQNQGIEAALSQMNLPEYIPHIQTGIYMNPFNDQYVNPNAYRYAAHTLLEQAGVTVLLGMPAVDAIVKGRAIHGVIIQGEFEKFAVCGKRMVDTTQGSSVCAFAGKKFAHPHAYMGTLPRLAGIDIKSVIEYIRRTDEKWLLRPMWGQQADPDQMERLVKGQNPLAIHGFMKALDQAIEDDPRYTSLKRSNGDELFFFYERDGMGAYWTFGDAFCNVDTSDPIAFSKAICEARKQQWLMHSFFKRYIPGFENAHLLDTYANISKALMQTAEPSDFTEYNLTEEEMCRGMTARQDTIVNVLGHPRAGGCGEGWPIPLYSLIPKELDQVLVTGKAACRRIHYIATCAMVGQAAGVSAAVSAKKRVPLRQTDAEQIRIELRRQGVLI